MITSAGCFNMSYNDGVLKIHIKDQTRICNSTNQEISFKGFFGTINYTNPKHVYLIMNSKLPHPKDIPTADEQNSEVDISLDKTKMSTR